MSYWCVQRGFLFVFLQSFVFQKMFKVYLRWQMNTD